MFPILITSAQEAAVSAPCGVVDAIGFPIDGIITDYDDFALYRPRFGGNHTGLDIGFGRWGDPVAAAARGRVTYSDVEGWGTEKGVVIIEHTFPDGSIYYTLYGHMEQTDSLFFPSVGRCVEKGDLLGGIGYPSRGAPHLHYEVRDFLPDDGGPGYVTGNPLDEGWYHPLDFTYLWQARLSPAYVSYATFDVVPMLPPVQLDSGMVAIASGNIIEGVIPPNHLQWRIETDGVVTGIAALPDDRVVAHTRSGQAIVLQHGRYAALWAVPGPEEPFLLMGETLVFLTTGGGLAAYNTSGAPLWTIPANGENRIVDFSANGSQIGLGLRAGDGTSWRLVDSSGQAVYETRFDGTPLIAPAADGAWTALSGTQLERIQNGERQVLSEITPAPGPAARMAVDRQGNSYLYLGDGDGTLMAVDVSGAVRWRIRYPYLTAALLPPVMQADDGCVLYTLDADGMFNVFSAADGALLTRMQLYAGGRQSGSPRARLLQLDQNGHIQVGGGFLTIITFDTHLLTNGALDSCLLG